MNRHRYLVLAATVALAAPAVVLAQAEATDPPKAEGKKAEPKPTLESPKPSATKLSGSVYRVPIEGFIGPGLAYFVKRSVQEAKDTSATHMVFEINTNGGGVDPAIEICEHIGSAAPVKTVAYVAGRAWSAGALIAISCDEIYMKRASTMGSAQPVTMGKEGMEALGEKYVSALRAQFRSLAEEKGYHPEVAVAMVDKDIALTEIAVNGVKEIILADQVESRRKKAQEAKLSFEEVRKITEKGKLLNLSAKQALDYGFISGVVKDRPELLARVGVEPSRLVKMEADWTEALVRFVSHPAVSGILMMLGMLGIWMEFKAPGFGVPGTVGVACFALLFLSRFMLGHANAVEFGIFLLGLALLAVEIFVIPGFGVCGVAGIICIAVGLILSAERFTFPDPVAQPWDVDSMWNSALTTLISFFCFVVMAFFLLRLMPHTPVLRGLVLQHSESVAAGYVSSTASERELAGKTGVALSVLRPSGRAEIDGRVVDVVTEGDFVSPGQRLEVARVEGNRIVVRSV